MRASILNISFEFSVTLEVTPGVSLSLQASMSTVSCPFLKRLVYLVIAEYDVKQCQ